MSKPTANEDDPRAQPAAVGAWDNYVDREIGVYWYLFSNHCPLRCIYVERKQRKKLSSFLVSSNSIRAPSSWRSHASHVNRLTSSPRSVPSRARLGM